MYKNGAGDDLLGEYDAELDIQKKIDNVATPLSFGDPTSPKQINKASGILMNTEGSKPLYSTSGSKIERLVIQSSRSNDAHNVRRSQSQANRQRTGESPSKENCFTANSSPRIGQHHILPAVNSDS